MTKSIVQYPCRCCQSGRPAAARSHLRSGAGAEGNMVRFKNIQNKTLWVCICAFFMGLNILLSSFSIPVPGGHLYLNDIVICLSSLLLDPFSAMLIGGIGAFLGDFLFYPTPMFVSLVTHGLQALVISLIAHRVLQNKKWLAGGIGVTLGAIIMVVGYSLGRAYIYATPETAVLKLPFQILQAGVGAVTGWLLTYPAGMEKLFHRTVRLYTKHSE